jgi:hypothetical protein
MDDVERLARWLHRTVCRKRGRVWSRAGIGQPVSWKQLPEYRRDDYRDVARELLTNPPAVLCVPGVVVGGQP